MVRSETASNLLGRRREIEELEGKVGALKEELQKIQKVILDKRERRNALRDELTEMTRQLQQLQIGSEHGESRDYAGGSPHPRSADRLRTAEGRRP